MPYITLRDGAQLYYKDQSPKDGPVFFFSHGRPLNSDDWENQMFFLANHGCRVVARDRRGHRRSEQTWEGNDVDSWTDDIQELVEKLDLKGMVVVGCSTGGSELVRYCARREFQILCMQPRSVSKTDISTQTEPYALTRLCSLAAMCRASSRPTRI